ncbi:MAG: hypothetical protein QNL21_08220, partial [Flavobacteriales bacterium]
EIGTGTSTDDFTMIDWANGPYFMETAVDLTGGSTYEVMGTSQLMSVPYALYAKTSGNGEGPQGPAGVQGPQGIQGIAGIDGQNGVDGINGADGSAGPQGLQGPAGENGIDGLTGAQGIQGDTGMQGETGFAGAQGVQGNTGAQGPIGETGAQGPQGIAGINGQNGADGLVGAEGDAGVQGIQGIAGPQGETGVQGLLGIQGETGEQGIQGIPGAQGENGVQGPIGLTGEQGEIGAQGDAGAQGVQGITGAQGENGIQGPIGLIGAQGEVGEQGPIGETGAQGDTGAQGIQGIAGIHGQNGEDGYTPMFGVDYFNGQDGTNGADGLDAVIDSVYVDSLVQSYVSNNNSPGGGCDFSFPEGYGNHISISPDDYSGNYYVVPTGKRLYVFGGALVYVNDRLTTPYSSLGWKHNNPIILNSGDSLSHGGGSGPGPQYFDCMLLNENTSISAVNREISASNPYIVPLGKEMYVMTIQNSSNLIRVNNKSYFYGTVVHLFPGDTLAPLNGINTINGYLVDENYFANCGGGDSSSTPVLNNESSSSSGVKLGFSESTSWICPQGITQVIIELWGGAGGSGSSSGYSLGPGTSCFISADGSPCSPTIQGWGAPGGIGGNGGYSKIAVDVVPGQSYNIMIGNGGAGGAGGFGVGVNSGTFGGDGSESTFLFDGDVLGEAEGGFGGGFGTVACCSWPSLSECPGYQAGIDGANGIVENYTVAPTTPDARSFIPEDYLTAVPSCCSAGGTIGGLNSQGWLNHYGFGSTATGTCNSAGACINLNNCSSDQVRVSPFPGVQGESGFVVISF